MEKEGKVKINVFKLILKILYNILIIFCVILIAIIFMQKVTNSNGSVAGYRIFRVVTGSMVPKYDIGEVVICKETDPKDIEIGDSIVYRGRTGQMNGKTIMHEVIGIDHRENGTLTFHVKGIANNEEDPEVRTEQIYGVVKLSSPILTLLYRLATSIYSAFVIVTILVINVFISFKTGTRYHDDAEEIEDKNKRIEQEKEDLDEKENSNENEDSDKKEESDKNEEQEGDNISE